MSRTMFLILWLVIASGILTFMALAWRARNRRDAGLALPDHGLAGDVVQTFEHVGYVSTTPAGAPLERLAIPGLRYKGWADVTVRRDGVEIAVTGERPVHLAAASVRGTDSAGGRIGKVVERDGLALLGWEGTDGRPVESSFRFSTVGDQRRFAAAVGEIAPGTATENFSPPIASSKTTHTSQEDA
ncbi:PH-like domain-containing protein [Leucobacter aridicollis]|uniref:PH-like domain-containing protein n=1 Tax=Leucobacter aridicollis TaxID=283878 RepID=UPI000E658CB8|nr:hypothetical protein [Leucobacter aridicollis]UTX51798.1 hypothetical protein KI794_08350 [Leucobacter aridicollis]